MSQCGPPTNLGNEAQEVSDQQKSRASLSNDAPGLSVCGVVGGASRRISRSGGSDDWFQNQVYQPTDIFSGALDILRYGHGKWLQQRFKSSGASVSKSTLGF